MDTLTCGGIGGGAQNAMNSAGIRFYGGVSGSADESVDQLLAGTLGYNPNVVCNHHGEHHDGKGYGHHHEDGGCGHHHDWVRNCTKITCAPPLRY